MNKKQKNSAKSSRAQAAIEFTILIAFVGFVFVLIFGVFGNIISTQKEDIEQQQLDAFLQYIEDEINLAKGSPTGFSRVFTVPPSVNEKNYTFTFQNDAAAIALDERQSVKLFPAYTNGSFCVKPINTSLRTITITKRSPTEVFLENCNDCIQTAAQCESTQAANTCNALSAQSEQECCDAYCFCCS